MQLKICPELDNDLKLIEHTRSDNVIVLTKYGLCKTTTFLLRNSSIPTITTALCKTSFFKNKLRELFPQYEDSFSVIGEYVNGSEKIEVTDGTFTFKIRPRHLLSGVKPAMQSVTDKTKYALYLIEKIHGNYYTYAKFKYNGKEKSIITCPIHGDFEQSFTHHNSGKGCNKCGIVKTGNSSRSNSKDFIEKANIVHNSLYSYHNTNYTDCKTVVDIECALHGTFQQIPSSHLQGHGCMRCAIESFKGGYTRTDFVKVADNRDCFLYMLKFFDKVESFYKIGITSLSVNERFKNKSKVPYDYEIIYEYTCDAGCVWDIEKTLHRKYKDLQYHPFIYFGGHTECFNTSLPIQEIISYLNSL